jgi:4-amino-4-deoxy-L-arabinose transferase-like glycosyltransferase
MFQVCIALIMVVVCIFVGVMRASTRPEVRFLGVGNRVRAAADGRLLPSKQGARRGVFICALYLGLLFRLSVFRIVDYRNSGHDEGEYELMARNILRCDTFSLSRELPCSPTVARPPLQPAFLASVFGVFGEKKWIARIAQILLSLATVVILAAAVGKWNKGLGGVLLWAGMLSPFEVAFAPRLMAEPLCEFLVVLAFALPWLIRSKWVWTMAGAVLGLLSLARDVYGLLPAFVLSFLIMFRTRFRDSFGWRPGIMLALAYLLVIAPWTYRNYSVADAFIPISKGLMWENLWVGTWETFHNEWPGYPAQNPLPPYISRGEEEQVESAFHTGRRDAVMKKFTLERLRSQPVKIVEKWLERAPLLWLGTRFPFLFKPKWAAPDTEGYSGLKIGFLCVDITVLFLGLVGITEAARSSRELLWFAVPVVYTAAIYLPFHVETRYSEPVFLFVVLFAAFAVCRRGWVKSGRGEAKSPIRAGERLNSCARASA